jgi:hypothetical protein
VRRRLIAGALAVVGLVVLPVVARAAPVTAAPALRAGAARLPLRIPDGTPLAGYGGFRRRALVPDVLGLLPHAFWFKPGEGRLDEIAVRALVVYAGDTRVTWVVADVVAVDQAFVARLNARLVASGIRAGTLLVSASHTHSGPGAFLGSALFGLAAMDREDAMVRDAVLDGMVEAVRRAGTRARDAVLAVATVEAPDATTSRLHADLDRELVVVKLAATDGEPIAVLWNYAIHGTMLGARNLKLSGDVMGVASRALEAGLGVPALFVNGAVGDVSPRRHGEREQESVGRALAASVRAAWDAATPAGPATPALVVRSARVRLPPPALSLRHCVARWIPGALRVPLASFMADDTEMIAGALGPLAWLTMPGEPVTSLGREVKDTARRRWRHALVAGVTNDYLGYFVRPADYGRPSYVTCAAVYGPDVGPCLVETGVALLDSLTRDAVRLRPESRAPAPCDRAAAR